jgi:hypothetical protein
VDVAVWDVATREATGAGRADFMTTLGVVGVLLPIPFYSTSAAEACRQMQAFVKKAAVK